MHSETASYGTVPSTASMQQRCQRTSLHCHITPVWQHDRDATSIVKHSHKVCQQPDGRRDATGEVIETDSKPPATHGTACSTMVSHTLGVQTTATTLATYPQRT
jgi:hypothetical protein